MLILITRPREAAESFAAELRRHGHEVLIEPMLTVRPLPAVGLDLAGVQAVLLTSANAVPALPEAARALPVFAVGEATATAARRAGCPRVEAGEGDGVALARLVAARLAPEDGALLHLAGETVSPGPAETLANSGFELRRVAVYRTEPVAEPSGELRSALAAGGLGAATFFSPATATAFVRLVQRAGLEDGVRRTAALCLSPAVAAAVRDLPWGGVRSARRPRQEALLELLEGAGG